MSRQGQSWSADELAAAVSAYMSMLDDEVAGRTYSKSRVNESLRAPGAALEGRTKSSVEYRMQNISAALEAAGLPYIAGYKPAKNVGTNVVVQLQELIFRHRPDVLEPTSDPTQLEQRVHSARRLIKLGAVAPDGQTSPKTEISTRYVYVRCPKVKAWVLELATGVCEGCQSSAPFETDSGEPFLEVHHVQPLAEGGADTVSNAVALCPNCHRRCHHSSDRRQFTAMLATNVARLST